MGKAASLAERYAQDGFVSPIRALDPAQAADAVARLAAVTPDRVAGIAHPWLYKAHLLFPWIDAIARAPRLLDAVEAVLGPDLLLLSADIWRKEPGETRHISWHQDAGYWHAEPMAVLTAWVALTPATVENGCMRFARGGHRLPRLDHEETYAGDNMLSRGQTIERHVDPSSVVDNPLEPGEASLHHALLPHASGPNRTAAPRIGLALKYLPASVRQTGGPPWLCTLVRGRDHGHFPLEVAPDAELSAAARAEHHRWHAATRYIHF